MIFRSKFNARFSYFNCGSSFTSIFGINNFVFIVSTINVDISVFKSSKLLNLISCLEGWIFTSINDGSVSILITTIGYLVSSLKDE